MKLSTEAIRSFQKIYKKEFGEAISETDANEMGLRLLNVFKIVYKPIPKNEMRKYESHKIPK